MLAPRFVVTGTGRCGTKHIAHLLTAAGVRCGHEDWFGPLPAFGEGNWIPRPTLLSKARGLASRVKVEILRRRRRLEGDASWLAVPHLESYDGLVLLQLRDPLAVINSLVAIELFAAPRKQSAFRRKAQAFVPRTGNQILDAMRFWVTWNRWAAHRADLVYRIENLDTALLRRILEQVGGDPDRAEGALSSVPARTNTLEEWGLARPGLTWDELPGGPIRDELQETAEIFGYEVPAYHS